MYVYFFHLIFLTQNSVEQDFNFLVLIEIIIRS
jgi:hypothetical protein